MALIERKVTLRVALKADLTDSWACLKVLLKTNLVERMACYLSVEMGGRLESVC